MKHLIAFIALLAAASAQSATLQINVSNFVNAATVRKLSLEPTSDVAVGGGGFAAGPKMTYTPSAGQVIVSNIFPCGYWLTFEGLSTKIGLLTYETNGVINAASVVTVGTNMVNTGTVAYSMEASDARYASAAALTNLAVLTETANPTVIPASADGVLVFSGPHGNLRATVHPNALALATNWPAGAGTNGANLWLAFTATTNQAALAFGTETEDPFVASSSDGGLTWRVRTPFPLQTRAAANTLAGWGGTGWQADTELYIDPDGVMHLIWSGFLDGVNFNSVLFHSSTADGDTWSAPEIMHAGPLDLAEATYAGPQVVTMGDGTLRLYYVDENYGTNALLYQTGLDLSATNWNWAETNFCDTLPYTTNTSAPWHFDMVVRNGAEHIFYGSQSGNPGEYATSTNANVFGAGVIGFWPIATLTNKNANQQWIYKVTVWPSQTAPDAWNAIVGLSPANPTDMDGWAFKLIRDYQPDFNRMSVKTHTTNTWDLVGASKTYFGAARPAQFAVYEQVAPGNSATVTFGRKASGYGAVGFGTTPLNGSTRYALAGDGSVTLLNTFSDGRIRVADVDVGGWASGGIYAAASKQFSGSGAGLTNVTAATLVNAANVTNLSVWGSGPADGTRLWYMDEQLAYTAGTWYFGGGVDFSGAEVEGLVGITTTASGVPLAARGTAAQTANLFEAQDSASNVVASVSAAGVFTGNGSGLTHVGVLARDVTLERVPGFVGTTPTLSVVSNYYGGPAAGLLELLETPSLVLKPYDTNANAAMLAFRISGSETNYTRRGSIDFSLLGSAGDIPGMSFGAMRLSYGDGWLMDDDGQPTIATSYERTLFSIGTNPVVSWGGGFLEGNGTGLTNVLPFGAVPVPYPDGFTFDSRVSVYRQSDHYFVNLTPDQFDVSRTATRYILTNGSDAADGLSWDTAKATLSNAVSGITTSLKVYSGPGIYTSYGSANLVTFTNDMSLVCTGKLAQFGQLAVVGASLFAKGCVFQGPASYVMYWNNTSADKTLVMQDCTMTRGTGDGLGVAADAGLVLLYQCSALTNAGDGFNYTRSVAGTSEVCIVEIGCVGAWNGTNNNPANNNSTIHNGVRALRIDGTYTRSEGRSVHDVGVGSSWNLNCRSGGPRMTGTGINYGFSAGTDPNTGEQTLVILDGCEAVMGSYLWQNYGSNALTIVRSPKVLDSSIWTMSEIISGTYLRATSGITAGGTILTTSTTDSTSSTSGSIRTSGGASVAKTLWVGQNIIGKLGLSITNTVTASAFVATAAASATPAFKSSVTNNFILKAGDGGTWILRVGNDGTLTTVTNTSGL